jgi:hypothetical protein
LHLTKVCEDPPLDDDDINSDGEGEDRHPPTPAPALDVGISAIALWE